VDLFRLLGHRSDVEAGRGIDDVQLRGQGYERDQRADAAIAIPGAWLLDLQAGCSAAGAAGTSAGETAAGRVGAAVGQQDRAERWVDDEPSSSLS
jgi:hypothetical protein